MYSLLQRLRSLRHRLAYELSERVRWSRGPYLETPAGALPRLPAAQMRRIGELQRRHGVRFESELKLETALNNYEYLDILDRAWPGGAAPPAAELLCDVGCASFWYAAALDAFFRPKAMVGVEVEGYRLFRDGRARCDHAAGYLARRPHARFVVADYRGYEQPADLITAWFPFLTPTAILAWRLPLAFLEPEALLRRVRRNLTPGGRFVMINHGLEEGRRAHQLCIAADLAPEWQSVRPSSLNARRVVPPVVSCWRPRDR